MILEHILLAALYLLGATYQVMREIARLRKMNTALRPVEVFRTYYQEEWNTLIVSGLGLLTVQLFFFIIHFKGYELPGWLHQWGIYPLSLVAGYGWHRIVYKWLGSTEAAIIKQIDSSNKTDAP